MPPLLQRLWDRSQRRLHPLADAALAIGVAGAGRIALNSFISIGFGAAVFGRYAAAAAGVLLVGSLAATGPSAATTLGVARRWAQAAGTLPRGLVAFLLRLLFIFIALALLAGALVPGGTSAPFPLWAGAVVAYACYQVVRSGGYAIDRADAVTRAEAIGAILPLAAVFVLLRVRPLDPVPWLVAAFALGPATFLVGFAWWIRGRVRVVPDALTTEERRRAVRESLMFLLGAGSSMAMQYLPVVIAGRLQATTTAAVLYGALQATTPLLLLPRVYGAVMMPAFAADDDGSRVTDHLALVRPLFVPSLALALGLAPWVAVSLGLRPDPAVTSVAALVALMTLLQVWATPAVTVLSARRREAIPAVASAVGLVVAGAVWVVAIRTREVQLLPAGLALGAVVRSLVPVWILSGRPLGGADGATARRLAWALGLALVVAALSYSPPLVALAGGGLMVAGGLIVCYRVWADAHPAHP